ncbi:odorant receptor 131-2-like [Parambassis ranga]|uniref:Odorant receptor 131-2-like n=1 Tax=Parambassis ranga TaxID=210632 RepID=A0A6P7JG33_9TELE|nr:odorant receptor 131-2-like [Parambassis ranga]
MAGNDSLIVGPLQEHINVRVFVVQMLVMIFLCINLLLIVTFFKKECFYTTTRYILFSLTLLSDSLLLFLSDVLLILSFYQFTMDVWLCVIIIIFLFWYAVVTPVTLTAMTLERYVAICMPLHHGELCSTRSILHGILIIHGLSSVPCIVVLSTFFSSASVNFYKQPKICAGQIFMLQVWQEHVWSGVHQFYFLIILIILLFSYVKIMKVARAASGEDKKATWKGLRTVVLHGFQLLLCLIQLWCPFIETAIFQIDIKLFVNVRYFNYIMFSLAPKCLSPLIYGLRDETFFLALKNVVFYSLFNKSLV